MVGPVWSSNKHVLEYTLCHSVDEFDTIPENLLTKLLCFTNSADFVFLRHSHVLLLFQIIKDPWIDERMDGWIARSIDKWTSGRTYLSLSSDPSLKLCDIKYENAHNSYIWDGHRNQKYFLPSSECLQLTCQATPDCVQTITVPCYSNITWSQFGACTRELPYKDSIPTMEGPCSLGNPTIPILIIQHSRSHSAKQSLWPRSLSDPCRKLHTLPNTCFRYAIVILMYLSNDPACILFMLWST